MDGRWVAEQLLSLALPITALVVVPALILYNSGLGTLRLGLDTALWLIAGYALCLAGLAIIAVTIRLLASMGRGTLAPWNPTTRLVTGGIYAHTRNPMITGVLLVLLGESVLFWSLPVLIWCVLFAAGNAAYIRWVEEPGLIRRFGADYLEYRRNVPMWLPRLKPWKGGRSAR